MVFDIVFSSFDLILFAKLPILSHNCESGIIASAPLSPPTIVLLPFSPNAVGLVIIPPFAYHCIPSFGIGVLTPAILIVPVLTMCGVLIMLLIPLQTLRIVSFIELNTFDTVPLTELNTLLNVSLILWIIVFTPPIAFETTVLILSNANVAVEVITFHTF